MRKHNKLFKKSAGILLSASLAASVFAAPVSAAANYSEAADAALKEAASSLAEAWRTSLDNYEAPSEAESQSLSLTYEVNVDEYLLNLIPEDYKAIKDLFPLTIVQKQVMGTSPMFIQMNAESASGVKLTLNYLMDTENQIYYMQVPELSPNSVMVKGEGTEVSTEALQDYLKDPIASLPTPEEVESLYYNYPVILAKHVADAGTESTTITASDVSQEVTVYHGTMNQTETADAMKELIDYAEADEDLKNVLTKLSSFSEEDIYADLMDSIAELKADLENDSESTSEEAITTNLYENAEGKIVGFDADISGVEFKVYTTENGDQRGLDIGITEGGTETAAIKGSGTFENDAITGDYAVYTEGQSVVEMHLTNAGAETGRISFNMGAGMAESSDGNDIIASIITSSNIAISYDSNENAKQVISWGFADSDFATITLGDYSNEPVTPMTLNEFGTIYDGTNDEEMSTFTSELMENLPNVLPEDLLALFYGTVSEE